MTDDGTSGHLTEPTEGSPEREDRSQKSGMASGSGLERDLRRCGVLLMIGLAAQGLSLLGLHTPVGFMAFAAGAGGFIGLGMVYFLWAVVRGSTTVPNTRTD